MSHNIVFARPGSLGGVRQIAEANAGSSVPGEGVCAEVDKGPSGEQPAGARDSQKLEQVAPTTPGVYHHVCTYPGHWMRMHGALSWTISTNTWRIESYLRRIAQDRRPAA